jgi:hypothetical protein
MYANIEAKVSLANCREAKKSYGVRLEKIPSGWKYDWAFPLSAERAKTEGYGSTRIEGAIQADSAYPGCPYCGAKNFIVCGSCGRLNCYNTKKNTFTCGWCGVSGELVRYRGEGISSAGDV